MLASIWSVTKFGVDTGIKANVPGVLPEMTLWGDSRSIICSLDPLFKKLKGLLHLLFFNQSPVD